MPHVAVLGAGFQGTCAALELARRGCDVDLFDRNNACITQAGARNEGKIHLGFVYANDASFETAKLLAQAALKFDAALRRWLECDVTNFGLSSRHYYAVHRDSMLAPDVVLAHFARVRAFVHQCAAAAPCSYLGQDARTIAFKACGLGDIYDPATIAAVIETDERSVDARRMAALLRARVAAEPRIRFHPNTLVTQATRGDGSIAVLLASGSAVETRRYRHVVNCLWDGKLTIDRSMLFLPPYKSLYRLKHGINVVLKEPNDTIPSATFVTGPFGDVVKFDSRRLYLSWYPAALAGLSGALTPPDWPRELFGDGARQMIDATLAAFARLMIPMRGLHRGLFEEATVSGGIIVAAGETDIDDPESRLHTRTAVGIRSLDGYHSVDTGKYTLAPMYAIEIADRILVTT